MPDLLHALGTAIIPLTSLVSATVYLSTHPESPFYRAKRIQLPTHRDEGLQGDERDPFSLKDEKVAEDGYPVDADAFWSSMRLRKLALLITLLLPFAANITLLVWTAVTSDLRGDLRTEAILPPILLIPGHVVSLILIAAFLRQKQTSSHWPTTVHLSVELFVQFTVLATLALWPKVPFPPKAESFVLAFFSRSTILALPAYKPIALLRVLIPILQIPPLAIALLIRRGPPLHLPVEILFPPKVINSIPAGHPSLDPTKPNLSEEVQCTVPEYLLYGYATNVVKRGYAAVTMDVWDLPILTSDMRALPLYQSIKRIYGKRTKESSGEGYNLLWKLARANWGYLLAQQLLAIVVGFAYYLPHYLLQQLLEYLQRDPTRSNLSWGWLIAFGLFMSNALVYIGSGVIWSLSTTILQGRVTLQLNSMLFSKTLRKKDIAAIRPTGNGENGETADDDEDGIASKSQIMTLFTVDVSRVSDFVFHAFAIVDAPVEIGVATFYLLKLLGPSAIYGLLATILCLPFNHLASKVVVTAQEDLMKARDQRTALMSEILNGIRMLKFMAWERSFQKRVNTIREREIASQARNYQIEVAFSIIWELTPVLVTVVAFLHYTLVAKQTLTPATAFTSVAVFAELRYALNALPETLINALQGFVSCRRIEKYLAFAEVETREPHTGGDIVLTNATFAWARDESGQSPEGIASTATTPKHSFTLADLSLRFPEGKLSLICGRISSGKSLLLNGLLGEADLLAGQLYCPRSTPDAMAWNSSKMVDGEHWIVTDMTAFVPQEAWLQNASIRENIIFSSPVDEERYAKVLEACCLISDLGILEDGDQTEIGEKGLNLSGGQKARVSLARAVYSRSKVLLLDDVLSAVDAHTARAIMDQCLTGELLEGRTVLLVSHHTSLVSPAAEFIVALENGSVKFSGSRADFVECGLMTELEEENKADPTSPIAEKTVEEALKEKTLPKRLQSVVSLSGASPDLDSETSSIAPEDEDTLNNSDSDIKQKVKAPRKLIEDEKRATGRIAWSVWSTYFKAIGGPFWWLLFIFGLIVNMLLPVAEKGWLQYWTSADTANDHTPTFYVLGYALITLGGALIMHTSDGVMYYGSIQASRLLHNKMLESVLFAKLRFHDTTAKGRLLNRFGKDLEGLDSSMADNFRRSLEYGLAVIVTFVSISLVGGIPFVAAGCVLLVVYYQAGSIYGQTSRDLRRLDSLTRSPLYSLFGETVSGVAVYRAFGASTIALKHMIQLADTNIVAFAWTWTVNRWLSARFNLLSSVLVGITAVAVLVAPGVDASMAGFALAFAGTFSHNLLFVVRRFVQLEQSMVALERIKEYSELNLEAAEFIDPRPSASWPEEGGIKIEDLVVRYAPDLPNVLHGLSFEVRPHEKVGIVGATGCGKSTLALSFFRFVEAHSGKIVVDGIDISKVGLTDLRSRLTIIPQDPTILSGTLRSTLDVFDEYDDAEIYAALRRVHLISDDETTGPSKPASEIAAAEQEAEVEARNKNVFRDLNNPVSEGGDNFSSGEKQLICMARAILKRSKIVLMDEATASIDYETDELISKTIRHEFSDSTILTVAHRIHTIIDFDTVLVMDQGRIAEYASPAELLRDHKSRFYSLCRATGKVEFRNLKRLAMEAERKREGRTVGA